MRTQQQSWERRNAERPSDAPASPISNVPVTTSLDDMLRDFDQCDRQPPELSVEAMNAATGLARQAFHLNSAATPGISVLIRATALRIARELDRDRAPGHMSALAEAEPLARQQGRLCSRSREENRALALRELERSGPPQEFLRILDAMDARVSDARRVAEAIGETPAFGNFLLAVVNAPGSGLSTRVESVQRAVALLGFEEVESLVLAVSLLRRFRQGAYGPGGCGHCLDEIFMQAALTGIFARKLAAAANLGRERFFAVGMLCRAVSMSAFPSRLLEQWGAPARTIRLTGLRDDPARSDHDPAVCVLHLAEVMAQASLVGSGAVQTVSRLDPRCLEALGQPPSLLGMDQRFALREAEALVEAAQVG